MRRVRRLSGAMLLPALTLALAWSGQAAAGDGWPTPEEAVMEYVAGVAAADAGRVLAVSDVDEMAEGYRFADSVDRLGVFMPPVMLAPSEYPFFADIDRARRADEVLGQVLMLSYGLLSGETIDDGPIVPVDRSWAETFVTRVDPARLAGLEVMDVRFPVPGLESNEMYSCKS